VQPNKNRDVRDSLAARLASLGSPAFVAALALLIVNDVALKPLLHNAVTGKLSDFAGLFALALFVATFLPRQSRVAAWVIALAFAYWSDAVTRRDFGAL
jgi:hypothetical protein